MARAPMVVAQVALLAVVSQVARADLAEASAVAAELLDAWDVPAAAARIEALAAEHPAEPVILALEGRLRLLDGRYDEAREFLSQAVHLGAGGPSEHLLVLADNVAEETRRYVERLSGEGHFLVRCAPGPDEVMLPYAAEVLEAAWDALTPLFGQTPPAPVRVEIYPRVEVLGAVSSLTVDEIKTSGTIALCKYNRLMLVSPRDLVYGYTWADTLAHEFIHMLVVQRSHDRVPIWLHEGLAKYYEGRWRSPEPASLARTSEDLLARALADDQLVGFEEMSPSMAKLPSQEVAATAFAEVFTVMGFLERRAGGPVAERLVAAMAAGRSDREAVAEVAGLPWPRFEAAWRAHLAQLGLRKLPHAFRQKLLFRSHTTQTDELDELRGVRARRYVWLGDQLRLKGRYRAAVAEYRKAARDVGDETPLVQSKLGHALLELGEVDEAITVLERPLDVYPSYVLLHVYLGEAWLRKGELARARGHLEAASRINPFDPDLHAGLAEVYDRLGERELAERERWAHGMVQP